MAPAAVEATAPFHRSHSSPELLSTAKPSRELTDASQDGLSLGSSSISEFDFELDSTAKPQRTFSLASLPSFDVPSFDLSSDFETSFRLESKIEALRTEDSDPEVQPKVTIAAAVAAETDKLEIPLRKKYVAARRHSWLAISKSALSLRELGEDKESARGPPAAKLIKVSRGSRDSSPSSAKSSERSQSKPLGRSKTVESFADFAKRSWKSSSRSPSRSPSPSSERVANKSESAESCPDRKSNNRSPFKRRPGLVGRTLGSGSNIASVSNPDNDQTAGAEPPSSKSRTLNRASVYLTRTIFSKSPSSLSQESTLSPDAGSYFKGTLDAAGTAPTPASNAHAQPGAEQGSGHLTLNLNHLTFNPRNSSQTASSTASSTTGTAASENASQSTVDTGVTMPQPKSRDPLWATFRTLDVDFAKFAAKNSTAGKMTFVRSTLVPFLRDTAYHPSHGRQSRLTPEDIDRRATILNKWWIGLLELLDGGHSRHAHGGTHLQPVAGVDRPTLFEVTTLIMMRPEWRMCTTSFQPLLDRSSAERVRARSWTHSSTGDSDKESTGSNFLAESAEHNVRTMFQTNLLTQMAIVVDKMSQRHAPLSLVNWCGKACAYAFFFAPGIADVLVRLWVLNGDLLRRVADQANLPKRTNEENEDIITLFPRNLGGLGWTSVKALGDRLKLAAQLPLMPAKIPWHGPWVTRWRGGDTDLFFIFCKYYFILAEEFMPAGLPLSEKARVPAFVLVQAQLLATLDTTIHRQASFEAALLGPPLDALHGADAALTPITIPSNLLKGMDENRLIILLRDMLAEHSGVPPETKHTFAEAYVCTIKAATKRTSRYNHSAHFVLCDFLEEALTALQAYQDDVNNSVATSPLPDQVTAPFDCQKRPGPVDYVDWPFWFDVGRMILDSNSTMSEVRILSFLFAIWDTVTADPQRKKMLCVGWLLKDDVFEKFFNNWCPMVRAYYMRLLCWRVCRDSGSANDVDTEIFLLVSQRLKTVWAHYLWLKQTAEEKHRLPPSTAPCNPSPGKRFMILKTELPPPQRGLLLGFDPVSSSFPTKENALAQASAAAALAAAAASNAENKLVASNRADLAAQSSHKKKWSLLGKVLSFTAPQANVAAGVGANSGPKRNWDNDLEQARREMAVSRGGSAHGSSNKTFGGILGQMPGPPPPPKQTNGPVAPQPSSDSASSTGSSPVYDAARIVFRFTLATQASVGTLPIMKDRILTRPRLPAPAQARVSSHTAAAATLGNGEAAMMRGESPPPVAPGVPPETRTYSGLLQTGLVSEAKNARPLNGDEVATIIASAVTTTTSTGVTKSEKRLSLGLSICAIPEDSDSDESSRKEDSDEEAERPPAIDLNHEGILSVDSNAAFSFDFDTELGRVQKLDQQPHALAREPPQVVTTPGGSVQIHPIKPEGIYAQRGAYKGRALAEWSMVVNECNSFVDRRREEGVLGLRDVEVPTLGVEGMGLRTRG